jgi:hypothetical protein
MVGCEICERSADSCDQGEGERAVTRVLVCIADKDGLSGGRSVTACLPLFDVYNERRKSKIACF